MVQSYDRYEQEAVFGVIASQCNVLWLPPAATQSAKSAGRAATGGLEEVLIWDIKTGELMSRLKDGLTPGASNAKTLVAPSPVAVLAHHGASNILALGHADGSIKVWDLTSELVVLSFQGHKSAVAQLRFDSTGTRLCLGSVDATVIVWDLVAEEGLFKLKGHKAQITGMAMLFLPACDRDEGEDFLVTVAKDGLIKLWDLKARQCIETHLAHPGECWALGDHPDGSMLVTCGAKEQVKVWAVDLALELGSRLRVRGEFEKQSKARAVAVAFSRLRDTDGTHTAFVLQNTDRTCEVFRLRRGDELKKGVARRTKRLKDKGMADDEVAAALVEAEVNMLVAPVTVLRAPAKVRSCVWVPARKRVEVLLALANNSIELHSTAVPEQLRKGEVVLARTHGVDMLGHRQAVRAMDLSDDDRLLATALNGELKVWNVRTRQAVRTFALDGYALCCRFLPGGTLVVVGYKSGALELYDLALLALVSRVDSAHGAGDGLAVWSMDITNDGKTLVTGGNDKTVRFWNFKVVRDEVPGTLATVQLLALAHTQTLEVLDEVLCVKVSPDLRFLAISLLNNNVQVVFLDTLKLYLTLYGHKLPVLSIDISSDSKLVATSSADKNIKIWGLDFGDCHRSLFGHQDSVMCVRFLPDSHNFFTAGKDAMVKYWDGDKFQCVQKLPAHHGEVWALSVSRTGRFVVSAAHDYSLRVWAATEDQVFLEEEREKEMDELYENELLDSLQPDAAEDAETEAVSHQTMETLKAGEKLMEALDIGTEDADAVEEYERALAKGQNPPKPTPNTILLAYGISGQEHVLNTLLKIRSAQLEDALLVLPFSYAVKLMRFISVWTSSDHITANMVNLHVICRVLAFVMKANVRELVSQRDEKLRNYLLKTKAQLRAELGRAAKQMGYNTLALKFKKAQWRLNHETAFIDETEQREHEQKNAVKRTFATV